MHGRQGRCSPGGPSLWLEPSAPPCSRCGAAVALRRIDPHRPGFDLRCFECPKCYQVDRYTVEYGTSAPWEPAGSEQNSAFGIEAALPSPACASGTCAQIELTPAIAD